MEQEMKVIKITRIGRGLNVGYDHEYFLTSIKPNDNGYMDANFTSNMLFAMMFSESETDEMLGDIVAFVRAVIRNNIVAGRYDGRVSDYRIEVATLKLTA